MLIVKFEKMCLDTYGETDKIKAFLNLKPLKETPKLLDGYLKMHTSLGRDGSTFDMHKHFWSSEMYPYNSIRNSTVKAYEWRDTIPQDLLQAVESHCKSVIFKLGYEL